LLVCSVLWISFFLFGMCNGAPTVYIPQIRREANSTEAITTYIGRKIPFIFTSAVMVIAFIIFYTSSNFTQLLISQAMESILGASLVTISTMVMTEYTSPKYRGFFLTFKSATFSWGIWMSNVIGTFFHWKNIGLVKVILSLYPLILVLVWPESPYWLASNGKLEKSAKAHRWLKGTNHDSELELQRLISTQNKVDTSSKSKMDLLKGILVKDVYKPTLLCLCVLSLYTFSGKLACGFYSLDIIKKMTSSESTAYTGMLILDGITVLGMYIGTILSRFLKRRTLFLFSSCVGIGTLFILSLYVYLLSLSVLPENPYVSILLLSTYSMGIGCGPMIMCTSLYAELLPLKCRSLAICIVAISERLIMGSVTHLTPIVIRRLGLHAIFLCFASVTSFSGFPCVFVLSYLTRLIGRKICFIIACADSFIAFTVFYYSSSVLQILISEIMLGLFMAAPIVLSIVVLTEYTSPKYRGLFLSITSAMFHWGILASNAIGTFFHWKKIGLIGILCALYILITILLWPESPYWLASQGRYKECSDSHSWLKGYDKESEKELENMISTEKEYTKSCDNRRLSKKEVAKHLFTTVTSREFYKPTLISILTGMLSLFSGKLVCTVYAIDIIKNITDSESTAYIGMLILDGITVSSMYVGCALTKFLKTRTLLFVSSSIAVGFLFLMSLYLYLIYISVIDENKYISVCLLIMFSIAVSCGPLIMSTSVLGELIPIRSRNLAACLIAVSWKLAMGVQLKIAPYLIKRFGLHGVFLFFGISSCIIIGLLYKYLPETKDKTLQEIADSIMGVTRNTVGADDADKLMKTGDTSLGVNQNRLDT
ncbi:Sugar transporter, partial [Operophtera brumata]